MADDVKTIEVATPAASTEPAASGVVLDNASVPATPQSEPSSTAPSESVKSELKANEGTKLATQFAALSRKEKQVLQREQALKPQLEKVTALESLKTEVKKDRSKFLKVMEEYGVTYEELTREILRDQRPKADVELEQLKAKVEEERLARVQREEAEARAKYEQTISGFKGQIKDFISGAGEKYELIKENKQFELVYNVIEQHFNETGKMLSIEEAANGVEEYLDEEVSKIVQIPKVKKRFAPPPTPTPAEPSAVKTVTSPTLTNSDAANNKQVASRKLTPSEEIEEAVKLLRFK